MGAGRPRRRAGAPAAVLGLALLAAWWAAARSGRIPAVFLPWA